MNDTAAAQKGRWLVTGTSSQIAFTWLLHLRWGAVLCQTLLIVVVAFAFSIDIPLAIVTAIVGFEAASNLFFLHLHRRTFIPAWLFNLVMFLDAVLLTALLYSTGGPMNPFTFLYLVHIVLGAILMRPAWAWGLSLFTIACYGSFFLPSLAASPGLSLLAGRRPVPICCHLTLADGTPISPEMVLHLQGMWVAFAMTALFIVFFVGKIQKALERHQETLVRLKEEQSRSEKLASLATLSAGAAHEFSTPLSVIAVAAGEMVHSLRRQGGNQELIEDATLIREQVERCREILTHLAADAGEPLGEPLEEIGIEALLAEAMSLLSPEEQERVTVHNLAGTMRVRLPARTMTRIIKGLVKNGLDASPPDASVLLRCWRDDHHLHLRVEDSGCGMDEETLSKATEPFFTTKEPGKGLGLGLFLTKTVAERLGGEFTLSSTPGRGTTAVLAIALDRIAANRGVDSNTSCEGEQQWTRQS